MPSVAFLAPCPLGHDATWTATEGTPSVICCDVCDQPEVEPGLLGRMQAWWGRG